MTNLDAGAIQEVERLTRAAQPILTVPGEQKGAYYLRDSSGDYQYHRAELDPASVTTFDLDSAVRLANEGPADAIWVHDGGVVVAYQYKYVRWQVSLALPQHPAYALLSGFRAGRAYTQRELVRVLRTELAEYVDPTVISQFSALKFGSTDDSVATVRPAAQGLDRNIQRRVQAENGGEMPEQILFRVPVYDIPEARDDAYPVKVYVEFDHEAGRFVLVTVHNDLRAAQEAAVQKVMAHLGEACSSNVYYGKPSAS